MNPYPLLLRPMLFPKVWGGDRLARFAKAVRSGDRIGESWEVADLDSTSASGAGGAPARSIIDNGPLAGATIRGAIDTFGPLAMLGPAPTTSAAPAPASPAFPLLVKYLDARENLSVQVHPSIAYAKSHPGTHLKTECWYILDAQPGSMIYKGVRDGVTRDSFEQHLRQGDGSAVLADLEAVPAIPGEMHNLPSGTVHALGAGVLVAEVQTPSDTTFRVYDWGRAGRELHIDAALECITFGPARDATRGVPAPPDGSTPAVSRLVSTGFYIVDEVRAGQAEGGRVALDLKQGLDRADRALVLMCVQGSCLIQSDGSDHPLALGQTAVVPAGIVPHTRLLFDRPTTLLRAVVMR